MERRSRGLRGLRGALAAVVLLGLVGLVGALGVQARWFRPPYPPLGKRIAWALGLPEPAYNFDVVRPGRVYRSSEPDARLVRHVHETYAVRRIVSLVGEVEAHAAARALGIEVSLFDWPGWELPPRDELERVVALLDEGGPVLVHCRHGMDRAGYAVSAYRVLRQRWPRERALAEMRRYGHEPSRIPARHRAFESFLDLHQRPGRRSEAGGAPG